MEIFFEKPMSFFFCEILYDVMLSPVGIRDLCFSFFNESASSQISQTMKFDILIFKYYEKIILYRFHVT